MYSNCGRAGVGPSGASGTARPVALWAALGMTAVTPNKSLSRTFLGADPVSGRPRSDPNVRSRCLSSVGDSFGEILLPSEGALFKNLFSALKVFVVCQFCVVSNVASFIPVTSSTSGALPELVLAPEAFNMVSAFGSFIGFGEAWRSERKTGSLLTVSDVSSPSNYDVDFSETVPGRITNHIAHRTDEDTRRSLTPPSVPKACSATCVSGVRGSFGPISSKFGATLVLGSDRFVTRKWKTSLNSGKWTKGWSRLLHLNRAHHPSPT